MKRRIVTNMAALGQEDAEAREFGQLVREAREKVSMKAVGLAHVGRVSAEMMKDIEEGRALPSIRTFSRMSAALPRLRPLKAQLRLMILRKAGEGESAEHADLPPESLAVRLREAREEDGLTQKDVADLIGVKAQSVQEWEAGNHLPVLEHFKKLLEIWPDLEDAKPGEIRDIPPPSGGVGAERQSPVGRPAFEGPPPILAARDERDLGKLEPVLEPATTTTPKEEEDTMADSKTTSAPANAALTGVLTVWLHALLSAARSGDATVRGRAFEQLLGLAGEAGMSPAELGQLLRVAGGQG